MFLHISFLAVVIVVAWAFHRYQLVSDHLLPFVKRRFPRMNQYTQLQSFSSQAGAGLTSSNFDLEANNIRQGDLRTGLNETAAADIQRIMRDEHVSFDEARLRYARSSFARNGVDQSGMPTDSKAITRL